MNAHSERTSVNAIRLMLLTGARRGEVLGARWDMFDLDTGVWINRPHTPNIGASIVFRFRPPQSIC